MLINTLLLLAVLAFVAYLVGPRLVRGVIRWRRFLARWSRYNEVCRIRRKRTADRAAEKRYEQQLPDRYRRGGALESRGLENTSVDAVRSGRTIKVSDVDGVVYLDTFASTRIDHTNLTIALDRQAQVAWAQEIQRNKEKEDTG